MTNNKRLWGGCVLLVWAALACAGQDEAVKPSPQAVGEMVLVPAGEFIMGSDKVDSDKLGEQYGSSKPFYVDEHPRHKVNLPAFKIDKYEVTNAQYREFVRKTNYWFPAAWKDNGYLLTPEVLNVADLPTLRKVASDTFHLDMDTRKMERAPLMKAIAAKQAKLDPLPVAEVTWFNAHDFCTWVGKRLPTEAEWEKAARGTDGREYPWGNKWDNHRLNAGEVDDWEFGVAPVGSYPQGASPYGAMDMAGNVMEWVKDWYQPYAGNTYKDKTFGEKYKVVRGGGWGGLGHYALSQFYRTAYRLYMQPGSQFIDVGFRCAKDVARH